MEVDEGFNGPSFEFIEFLFNFIIFIFDSFELSPEVGVVIFYVLYHIFSFFLHPFLLLSYLILFLQ